MARNPGKRAKMGKIPPRAFVFLLPSSPALYFPYSHSPAYQEDETDLCGGERSRVMFVCCLLSFIVLTRYKLHEHKFWCNQHVTCFHYFTIAWFTLYNEPNEYMFYPRYIFCSKNLLSQPSVKTHYRKINALTT